MKQKNEANQSPKLLLDLSTFGKVHKGGKDEVAYNLLRGFSKLGYTNRIICTVRPELTEIIYQIDPEYTVIPMNRYQTEGRIGNLLSTFTDLLYGLRLRKVIRQNNCNRVLFTNKLSPFIRQPVRTHLLPHDIQFFRVLEGNKQLKLYTRVYALFMKINFKCVDRIIAISDFDKSEMIRYMPQHKEKIIRIYDPICFKTIIPDDNRTYITALNIQHYHKNTLTLVKAYARIAPDITENLVLVGRKNFLPEVEEEISRIIAEKHLENRVIFTGFVSETELNDIISKTRIFVNPSLFEGFGMAAVEMMASEVPTIVADNSAQKEATLGLCRYYKPAADDKALTETILEELNHPISEEKLKEIAGAIRDKYDYVEIAKEYWNTIMKAE